MLVGCATTSEEDAAGKATAAESTSQAAPALFGGLFSLPQDTTEAEKSEPAAQPKKKAKAAPKQKRTQVAEANSLSKKEKQKIYIDCFKSAYKEHGFGKAMDRGYAACLQKYGLPRVPEP